jgi:hypothetical protein
MKMDETSIGDETRQFDMDDIISQHEREHLLFGLQRYLVWVGEPIPEEVTIQGQTIQLHDMIWKLIHKGPLTEPEKKWVRELIHVLEYKEEFDEKSLMDEKLTFEEAKRLYHESAGLLRAIMDLKDLETGMIKKADFDEIAIKDKVEDARSWVKFMKKIQE